MTEGLGRIAGPIAPVALLAWYVWNYRQGEVLGLPTLLVWGLVLAAGLIGFGVQARVGSGRGPVAWLAALIAALVAAVLLVVAALTVGSTSVGQALAALAVLGGAASAAGAALAMLGRWRLSPEVLLAAGALAMWAVMNVAAIETDVHIIDGELLIYLGYDFHTYLAAGRDLLAGAPVYLEQAQTELPATTHGEPFLYPPVLLPAFVALASIPRDVAAVVFGLVLVAAAAVGLRLIGMRWTWAVLLVAYPPLFKGILSGNVASLPFLLYTAAPIAGALLIVGALFKVQQLVPALWLVRDGRWRDLATGVAAVLVIVLVTLPFVGGIDRWAEYVQGLVYREQSQRNLPILFGSSLAQYLPLAAFAALSVAVVLAALLPGGRKSLAMLGIATIVASPSLWPHGFVMALPAVLALPPLVLWLTLGVAVSGGALWLLPVVGAVSAFVSWDRLRANDPVDPMAGTRGPWARPSE